MSPDSVNRRKTTPLRVSVTITSRGSTLKNGIHRVCALLLHAAETFVTPTTSTDTGGPSMFTTISRADAITITTATIKTATSVAAMGGRFMRPLWCCGFRHAWV